MSGLAGSKLFDTLMGFLKEFSEKVDIEKNQTTKKLEKLPSRQSVKTSGSEVIKLFSCLV